MTGQTLPKKTDENRELSLSELSAVVAGGTYSHPKPMSSHIRNSLAR